MKACAFKRAAFFKCLLVHSVVFLGHKDRKSFLFFPTCLEFGICPHKGGPRDGRHSHQNLAALADIAYYSRLGSDSGVVGDFDMPYYANLTCYNTALSDLGGTGNSGHCGHCRVLAYTHIVRYLAEIVYADSVFDDGLLHRRPVNTGIGAYFHIVAYYHIADMLDFLP